MKKIFYIIIVVSLTSCVSDYDRISDCQSKFPKSVVTPCTSLLKKQGYELMVEDTINNQIYAVSYFPFSATKIWSVVNIR